MKIQLKKMILKNFKGIRDLTVDFGNTTYILGENATGKTTINDAFRWLLFDKDSTERKTFEIKTLNDSGEPFHGLEHSVIAEIETDGRSKVFEKIFKEKWQKKRGESESVFTGHETLYSINDVPMLLKEYQSEISALVDETIFKLITDPLYFSQTLKWQDRRAILTRTIDEVTVESVLESDSSLQELKELLVDETIENLRKSVSAKKKKLNDEIKAIPVRIDECVNSVQYLDFPALKKSLEEKQKRFDENENQLLSLSKVDSGRAGKVNRLNEIQSRLNQIERENEKAKEDKIRSAERNLRDKQSKLDDLKREPEKIQKQIREKEAEKTRLENLTEQHRQEWFVEKEKQLEIPEQFSCPTCNRVLETEDIEKKKAEMLENFNSEKAKKLESITGKGKDAKKNLDEIIKEIKTLNDKSSSILKQIEDAEEAILSAEMDLGAAQRFEVGPSLEYSELDAEKADLEDELDQPTDAKNELLGIAEEKKTLQKEIDDLKDQIRQEEANEKLRSRIKELEEQERKLAQQIADLEKQEFLCEKYTRTEANLLESKINSKFRYVKFKLFDTQINGGLQETCEAMINGVPFSDANHASKINAGIDIINTLSEFYNVSAPIFIDNREGINEIIPTAAQVVNLVVSKDKKLKIENNSQTITQVA